MERFLNVLNEETFVNDNYKTNCADADEYMINSNLRFLYNENNQFLYNKNNQFLNNDIKNNNVLSNNIREVT